MEHDRAQDMLADYLGGELDEAQARQFEAHLTENPALAAEVDSLRGTLAAMRALDEPAATPAPRDAAPLVKTDEPPALPRVDNRAPWRRMSGVLRYAAVVVFAFGAGYLANAVNRGPDTSTPARVVEPAPEAPDGAGLWEARVRVAYAEQHGRSGLARSLIALSRAARER